MSAAILKMQALEFDGSGLSPAHIFGAKVFNFSELQDLHST